MLLVSQLGDTFTEFTPPRPISVIEEIDKHMRVHYKKHNYERLYLTLTREDGDTNRSFCQQLDHAMQQFSVGCVYISFFCQPTLTVLCSSALVFSFG